MPKTFAFPVWLKGSPEEQAAETQRQDLLRASFTRAHLTEAERLVGRGTLLEATARGNLEQSAGKDKKARILAENQLADALAMKGEFAEAAEVHNDAARRKYFREIGAAIEMDDEAKCNCPDSTAKMGDVDLSITPRFERGRIFSPAHGQVVSLIECQRCGHQNARAPRSRLLPMNATRNQSEQARQRVLNDAQVLNAQ